MKITKIIAAIAVTAMGVSAVHIKQDPISLVEAECTATTSLEAAMKWKENLPDIYEDPNVIKLSGKDAVTELTHTPHKDQRADFAIAYHPQCPHCVSMVDEAKELAKLIKEQNRNVNVVAINMSKSKA